MIARWINERGYGLTAVPDDRPWWRRCLGRTVYEFRLDARAPLTLWLWSSYPQLIQPNRKYTTDLGSIPRGVQPLIPKDSFIKSFLLHDSGYKFGGMWVNGAFVPMERIDIDALCLLDGIEAEGGGPVVRRAIYAAVRAFGWIGYRSRK